MKSQRPKSSKQGYPLQNQAIEKKPSEFNLLNLNHNNVHEFLSQEQIRKSKMVQGHITQSFDETVTKNSNRNPLTDPDLMMSPGQSSVRSLLGDKQKESVQVYVRLRPPFNHEVDDDQPSYYQPPPMIDMDQQPLWSCIQVTPPSWITLHNYQESVQRDFQYSQVFGEQSSQPEVFQQSALPLVFHVLNGYHGCYFVYGQTGTGKTYSMGVLNKITQESQGIIPSSLDFIFRFFEEQQQEQPSQLLDWKVHISFYQIYQEQIQDLFNPGNKNLQVREEFGEVFVEDLVEVPVYSLHQAMTIINAGLEHRQMASQNMNLTSSRSHTILNIDVYQTKQISFNKTQQVSGRLTLVDLAGSERVRSTTSNGTRLEEAKHINASLSALGNVISSLASQKQQFIPYRSSKLTRVLQNSLSNQSKIVVLATLGPSTKNFQESLSTLQFASRCKEIQLTPVSHASIIQDDEEVSALKERIMDMQVEIEKKENLYNESLQEKESENRELHLRVNELENQAIDFKRQHDLSNRQLQLKNQKMADISHFAVQMLIKFVETSADQVNEAYDLNEKLLQLQQTMTVSELVKELDSEFSFPLEQRASLDDSELAFPSDFSQDDINMQQVVQQMTSLAQTHLEHINFLSQTANSQILLKQFTREHLDDFQLRLQNMTSASQDNLLILFQEAIVCKRLALITGFKEKLKRTSVGGATTINDQRMKELRGQMMKDLKVYVRDEVIARLNIIEGGELTKDMLREIDDLTQDQNWDLTLETSTYISHSGQLEPQPISTIPNAYLPSRKPSSQEREREEASQTNYFRQSGSNLSDALLRMKLMDPANERQNHERMTENTRTLESNEDSEQESSGDDRQSDLSDLIIKSTQLQGGNDSGLTRRNEFTFKKQVITETNQGSPSSGSERVIMEEEKESDYSQMSSQSSQQQSPVNRKLNLNQQQLKKMPESDKPRGDKIIRIALPYVERCFLKFFNYFLEEDGSQPGTSGKDVITCTPNMIMKQPNNKVGVESKQQPMKLIVKKQQNTNVMKPPTTDMSYENNHILSKSIEGDQDPRASFQGLRKQVQNFKINPNTVQADEEERFTFHQKKRVAPVNVFYQPDEESSSQNRGKRRSNYVQSDQQSYNQKHNLNML